MHRFIGYPAGSQQSSEPAFLVIGKLRRSHGITGEMLMEIFTDFPERIQEGMKVFIGETHQEVQIQKRRSHKDGLLLTFSEYDNPESVQQFRNQLVYVRADDRPALPEGEYYRHQLLGLNVIDTEENDLGKVIGVFETGANDVLIIRQHNGEELLFPYVDPLILDINLIEKRMRVKPYPGILS